MLRTSSLLFSILLAAATAGCAADAQPDGITIADSEEAVVASIVVVADSRATAAAEVTADRVVLPAGVAERYRSLTPGSVLVGARGASKSKNPDGFLRKVVSIADEGGALVVTTTPATLTDAILRGAMKTSSSGGGSFDAHGVEESSLRPLTKNELEGIAIDFSDKPLWDGVDEVDGAPAEGGGHATFTESIRLDRAVFSSRPVVDVDLRIRDGQVSRFVAKVEGNLDTSVKAHAVVIAAGDVNAATLAALRAKKHDVERVIYESPRVALPTFAVGGVPVSPSVQFKVLLKCGLAFGGPIEADAGVEARAYVRLGAVYENGAWGTPIRSDFAIAPSFTMQEKGEIEARCAIEAHAELFAYGTSAVNLSVAPYVDFGVTKTAGDHHYRVKGGASGSLLGHTEIFGIRGPNEGRPLVEWEAPALLEGTIAGPKPF